MIGHPMDKTEREISISCASSVQRDINKHLDRIEELMYEAKYFNLCIRDASLTNDELIASIEARIWWEDKK